jgi:hypothetical protein
LDYQASVERKEAETKAQERDEEYQKFNKFQEKINFSNDLNDQLQDLANHLQEFTHSTAVYIGKLVSPKRPINEDDDENAHKDDDAPKIIHYINATKGHEYLVDKILR